MGWSPSTITIASASAAAPTPARNEAEIPSCQSVAIATSVPSRSTRSRTASACAPSTTTIGSIAGTARIASSACSSSGLPRRSASCLGEPKRVEPPAARTTPAIKLRPRGSAPPLWPSRPPPRPLRTATTSARIESAVSSGVTAPRSRPIGAAIRSISASVIPRLEQARAALVLRSPAAHRADVGRLGAQRDLKRGVVELRVVGEDRDVGGAVDAELSERLVGPRGDDLLGLWKPHLGGERLARVADERAPARRPGRACRAPPRSRRRRGSGGAARARPRR